jgi:hypothetical protein
LEGGGRERKRVEGMEVKGVGERVVGEGGKWREEFERGGGERQGEEGGA